MTGGAIGAASCGGVVGRFPTGCGCTFSTGGLFTLAAAREGSLVAWPRASKLSMGRLGVLRTVFGVGRSTARTCWSGFFKEVFGIFSCCSARRGSALRGCKSIFASLGLGALGILVTGGGVAP